MYGAMWLCVLALALPCWAYPSGHATTCEEFGRGISFDPVNAMGEWYTVYCFQAMGNLSESITIKELSSPQLQQYDQLLRDYSQDKLKLELKIHKSYPLVLDVTSVLVPKDNAGNVNAWIIHLQKDGIDVPVLDYGPYSFKWKSVDGFLVVMLCDIQKVFVLSKTATPDYDKLQRVANNLDIIKSTTGGGSSRVYSSLLTLL